MQKSYSNKMSDIKRVDYYLHQGTSNYTLIESEETTPSVIIKFEKTVTNSTIKNKDPTNIGTSKSSAREIITFKEKIFEICSC